MAGEVIHVDAEGNLWDENYRQVIGHNALVYVARQQPVSHIVASFTIDFEALPSLRDAWRD